MKRLHFGVSIGLLLSIVFFPANSAATSWVYPFVVWNDGLYVVSDEQVDEANIGENIGRVTRFSDMEQYGGNFSNIYEKGTKYYKIAGVSTSEAIAVEDEGYYVKAVWEKEYTYGSDFPLKWLSIGSIVTVLIMFYIFWYRKSLQKS